MKRFISLVLCIMVAFTFFSSFAFAESNETGLSDTKNVVSYSRDLTYQEAINLLMEKKGYSLSKAKLVLGDNASDFSNTAVAGISTMSSGSYIFREYRSTQDFGKGATVEYGVLAKIYVYDSFRQFDSIADKWSLPGSGTYTFNLGYHSPVVNTPPSTMTDYARGQVEYAVTYSSTVEANVGVGEFIQAGYAVSSSVGLTYYFRKTLSFSTTYSLY